MIDRLLEQIEKRLDELAVEEGQLRAALIALDASGPSTASERRAPARSGARSTSPRRRASIGEPPRAARRVPVTAATGRTARGQTRASVLAALASGEAMTATQVAGKAGLGRATVSTTLSKLARSGAVQKAARGYRLVSAAEATGR